MANQFALSATSTTRVIHPTTRKIENMRSLRSGWFYGGGEQVDEETIQAALELNEAAISATLYETDVFPAESGELMVTVYYREYCLEMVVEKDGTISTMIERADEELESCEYLSLDSAKEKILEFRELVWKQSDFYPSGSGIQEKADFQVWHSAIQVTAPVFQSLTESAPFKTASLFADTLSDITLRRPAPRRSSGVSTQAFSLMASS